MNSISPSAGPDRWASAPLSDDGFATSAESSAAAADDESLHATGHADDETNAPAPEHGGSNAAWDEERPTLLQSVERMYGMAPGSVRYDNAQDLRDVRMVPVFKIEGGGGVHERITQQAAKNANIRFSSAMDKGVAWPDVPCQDPNAVKVCYAGTGWNQHREGTLANRSHHGDLQFWHSMAPKSDKVLSNAEVVDKIVGQAKEWYTQGVNERNDFPIGKMLHMVQDSYSASHVIRDKEGRVKQFQGYDAQDAHAHGHADKKGKGMESFLDIPGARGALSASTKILEFYARRAPFSEVETYLRQQVYPMAPSRAVEPAGGTAAPYAKKAVEA